MELLFKKKQSLKLLQYAQENVLESLSNKVSEEKFYFSFGKT